MAMALVLVSYGPSLPAIGNHLAVALPSLDVGPDPLSVGDFLRSLALIHGYALPAVVADGRTPASILERSVQAKLQRSGSKILDASISDRAYQAGSKFSIGRTIAQPKILNHFGHKPPAHAIHNLAAMSTNSAHRSLANTSLGFLSMRPDVLPSDFADFLSLCNGKEDDAVSTRVFSFASKALFQGFMPFSAQELGGSLMLSNGNGSADKFSYANGSKVSPAQLKLLSPADHMFNNCGFSMGKRGYNGCHGGYKGPRKGNQNHTGVCLNLDGIVVSPPGGSNTCLGIFCGGVRGVISDPKSQELGSDVKVYQALRNLNALLSAKDPKLFQQIILPFINKIDEGKSFFEKFSSVFDLLLKGDRSFNFCLKYWLLGAALVAYYQMGFSWTETRDLVLYKIHETSGKFKNEVYGFRDSMLRTEADRKIASVQEEASKKKIAAVKEASKKKALALEEASKKKALALEEASKKKALAKEEASKKKAAAMQEAAAAEKRASVEAAAAVDEANSEYESVQAAENESSGQSFFRLRNPLKAAAKKAAKKKMAAEAEFALKSSAVKIGYANMVAAADKECDLKSQAADKHCVKICDSADALVLELESDADAVCMQKAVDADAVADKKKMLIEQELEAALSENLSVSCPPSPCEED